MPIEHAIWRVGNEPSPLPVSRLATEQTLEGMIVQDPRILSAEWMLIGRQEVTSHAGRVDLLAIAPDGALVLIELKKDRTPREIVAQALDYASWVEGLSSEEIAQIYQRFSKGESLSEAFRKRFGTELDEESLNQSHQIIIVAATLDSSTERIIGYLNSRDVAINVLFFQVFANGNEQFLSRSWLIDPGETQANAAATTGRQGESEPWNGETYVSFGGDFRSWDEAREFGFVSAGGGSWYSRALRRLEPGDRIWVLSPDFGYVGVGRVKGGVVPAGEFTVVTPSGERPVLEVLRYSEELKKFADDPENAEYFVRVDWLDTVDERSAVREVGLFGNRNTVCKPPSPKWRHTVERLKSFFPNWDGQVQPPVQAPWEGRT